MLRLTKPRREFFISKEETFKRWRKHPVFNYISDILKTSDLKKNLHIFEINSKKKIVLVSLKNNLKNYEVENLGAELYGRISHEKKNEYFILSESATIKLNNFLGYFLHGLKLKSYKFKKYKTKEVSFTIAKKQKA